MEKQSQRINKPRQFTGKYPAIKATTADCGVAWQNELKATESEWSEEKEHASACWRLSYLTGIWPETEREGVGKGQRHQQSSSVNSATRLMKL